MILKRILLTVFFLVAQISLAQEISSPSAFLGYELGTQFSRHADVVSYFSHVASQSSMVSYHTYGRTNERRPLTYAIVSAPENLKNIESLRDQHLKAAGILDGTATTDKAIVWLSYNVHGNESSSTEAAMETLYELITSKKQWLENTIVIIDPCVNPDGRDRYANWYNQVKATPYNTSQLATEHHEPWPGGRPNHYLFDLNRDWAWATQIETRERLKIYNQWMPHIHVDFHEQGINDPYYFAPAAEPFHEIITPFQREFQTEIGKNHAKYFDAEGWLYFTKERFDLLYPSYGDTYPTFMGAIGMTYEQAGHGRAGLGIETDEGYVLTLKDRIAHHHTTGLSTVEVAHRNAEKLTSEFPRFFQNDNLKYKSYIVNGSEDKIDALKKLLNKHDIKYHNTTDRKVSGFNYTTGKNGTLKTGSNSLIVHTDQPKGKMVKVLFEPSTKLSDSLTYDITAWSIPHAYGLQAIASTKAITTNETIKETTLVINEMLPEGAGYISKWNSIQDAAFLAELLKNDIKVRFTERNFRNGGKDFDRGSLVITKSDNRNNNNFDKTVVEIANKYTRKLHSAITSFAEAGPDFGSPDIKLINKQRIAVLKGDGVSSLNYGEIWYFFEQELHYPITAIDTDYFKKIDLSNFDVLVMPEGSYNGLWDDAGIKRIKDWVQSGGKVIAIGDAVSNFADKEGFGIKINEANQAKDSTHTTNLIPYNKKERNSIDQYITGSIMKTKVDNSHPMAFGYGETYASLKISSNSFALLDDGYNVAYMEKPEVISGYAGKKALENLKNSIVFAEHRIGSGSVIYLVDNPLYRAFWENGKLFFVNSVFLVNNNKIRI